MPDLDDRLRAEFRRDDTAGMVPAAEVIERVYARRRTSAVRRGVAGAVLVGAAALAVPVVVTAAGDDGATAPVPATTTPLTPAAPTLTPSPPGETHVPLGNPSPRTVAFPGVPESFKVAENPPDQPFDVPAGDAVRYWVTPAGSPVAGLVWVRQPHTPTGLPGLVFELPPGISGDTQTLATDDPWENVLHMSAYSPSGDQDFLIVYGGDSDARKQVIVSIIKAAFG